ncbi:MAG: AAA family ATPase, partial [Halobacteria archaeon]|nr:AAA family ATPase [Halobacteria archaeon]
MIDSHENYYKYKLSADPFRLSPDHRFAFSHPSYAKAKAYLEFALRRGEGFITITGGPGTGKTTLINEIVAGIRDADVLMATLNSTQLESRDLLHMVAAAFGLHYGEVSKPTLLLGLEEFLTQQKRHNKHAVLIVDEAQGLSPSAIEELRLLANLQLQSRLLLQVVLVGQERLRDVVQAPGMEHLSQRIIVASHLDPLTLPDTVAYVEHRLKKVRWQGDPAITEDALRLIHKFSGGVPRLINLICSRLFLFGGLEGTHELTGEDAQSVIEDLQQESLLPNEASESIAGQGEEQTKDSGEVVLSLPRDAPAAAMEDREDSSQEPGEPEAEWVVLPEMKATRAEVEDIPSSKTPLHEALRQVFSTLEHTDQPGTGSKRRPPRPDERAAAGAGGPVRKPGTGNRARPRAAPGVNPAASQNARKPGTDTTHPEKRRNVVAVVVVAVGLVLAFSLLRLDRVDTPPESAVITMPGDPLASQSGAPAEYAVTGDDQDTAMAVPDDVSVQLSQENDGELTGSRDVSADSAEPEQTTQELESQQRAAETDQAQPLSSALSPALTGEDAIRAQASDKALTGVVAESDTASQPAAPLDTDAVKPVPGEVAADKPVVATIVRQTSDVTAGKDTELTATQVRAPLKQPVAVTASQPEPVAKISRPPLAEISAAAQDTASSGPQTGNARAQRSQAEINAEMSRLEQAARRRFTSRLKAAETDSARNKIAQPAVVARATSVTPPAAPQPSQPKARAAPARPKPSAPKTAVTQPPRAAVPAVTRPTPVNRRQDRIKAALLQGQWTSQGKPASLLPSDVTLCRDEQARIACRSVPRNINTKFGEALYKVEATLENFSADGDFRITYKTLVKLLESGNVNKIVADTGGDKWQVSEYTTTCQLTSPN